MSILTAERFIHLQSARGASDFYIEFTDAHKKNNSRKSRILHVNVVNQRVSSLSGKHKTKRYLFTGLSHLQVSYTGNVR